MDDDEFINRVDDDPFGDPLGIRGGLQPPPRRPPPRAPPSRPSAAPPTQPSTRPRARFEADDDDDERLPPVAPPRQGALSAKLAAGRRGDDPDPASEVQRQEPRATSGSGQGGWVGAWLTRVAEAAGVEDCCSMRSRAAAAPLVEAERSAPAPEQRRRPAPAARADDSPDRSGSDSDRPIAPSRREEPVARPRQDSPPRDDGRGLGNLLDDDSVRSLPAAAPRALAPSAPSAAPRGEEKPSKYDAPPKVNLGENVPEGHLYIDWKWPAWCLDFKNPDIEVYVVDDEDPSKGKWVKGEPRSRVVDKKGNDTHLFCEYIWEDEESYVQDFGPHHVRKTGEYLTVMDLYDKTRGGTDGAVFDAQEDWEEVGGQNAPPKKKGGWGLKVPW